MRASKQTVSNPNRCKRIAALIRRTAADPLRRGPRDGLLSPLPALLVRSIRVFFQDHRHSCGFPGETARVWVRKLRQCGREWLDRDGRSPMNAERTWRRSSCCSIDRRITRSPNEINETEKFLGDNDQRRRSSPLRPVAWRVSRRVADRSPRHPRPRAKSHGRFAIVAAERRL